MTEETYWMSTPQLGLSLTPSFGLYRLLKVFFLSWIFFSSNFICHQLSGKAITTDIITLIQIPKIQEPPRDQTCSYTCSLLITYTALHSTEYCAVQEDVLVL